MHLCSTSAALYRENADGVTMFTDVCSLAWLLSCYLCDSFPLQYAQDFESVLLSPKDGMGKPISWSNSAALEGYVRRLQQVAEQLKQKNRCLLLFLASLAASVTKKTCTGQAKLPHHLKASQRKEESTPAFTIDLVLHLLTFLSCKLCRSCSG